MAHRKIKNYQGSYQQYSNRFAAVRSQGKLHKFAKKFTKKQFDMMRAEGTTIDEMVEAQAIPKHIVEKSFKQYEYLRDNSLMRPGDKFETTKEWDNSYWGGEIEEVIKKPENFKLGYHRTMSGFLKDKHAIHFMITFEIELGELSREEVLDEYGYHD